MKKLTLLFGFILVITMISFVGAEPCSPGNPPGCQDICGDQICGNSEGFDTCAEDCDYCIDTEESANEFVKGIVTYNREEINEDVCTKDLEVGQARPDLYNQLVEISCANERGANTGGVKSMTIDCEYGCENGACVESEPNYTECADNDPNKDIYLQGVVRYNNIENRDVCIDATRGTVRECSGKDCNLHEFYCNEGGQGLSPDNKITFDSLKCSYKCKEGVCVKPPCEGCLIEEDNCIEYGIRKDLKYCFTQSEQYKNLITMRLKSLKYWS